MKKRQLENTNLRVGRGQGKGLSGPDVASRPIAFISRLECDHRPDKDSTCNTERFITT